MPRARLVLAMRSSTCVLMSPGQSPKEALTLAFDLRGKDGVALPVHFLDNPAVSGHGDALARWWRVRSIGAQPG